MSTSEIAYMPAVEIAAAIREKKFSPVEVVDAILTRIDELNAKIDKLIKEIEALKKKKA